MFSFFPNEYFIIIIYIKYVPTRPFCWMIISVERTLKLHYYTVEKVFSASPFPIFLCYSLIPKWIPFFFPLHPTPHAYFGDAALAATGALARLPAAPWLVWGFYGCGSSVSSLCWAADHQPSASRCRRFSGTALCRADHNSWQPHSAPRSE